MVQFVDQSEPVVEPYSRVGCAMACSFCATGLQGFARNLSAAEIVNQVLLVEKEFGTR